VFCVVDYDGVLAPVADTPEAALPPPGIDDILRQLAAAGAPLGPETSPATANDPRK
jgi:hypothetical protein